MPIDQRDESLPHPCPPESEIAGFAIGDLPDDDALRLSRHIARCPVCEETLDTLRHPPDTLTDVLKSLDSEPEYLDEPELNEALKRLGNRDAVPAGEETPQIGSVAANSIALPLDRPPQLGRYRLESKLGQGGMGAVYKAIHTQLDKTVAIKVLAASRFGDVNSTNRFKREMKAIGRVQHPNVVVAHDGGQIDHEHFLVMEYVDGVDISKLDRRHKGLPVQVACEIIRQAAIGLQHAHDKGLIHRDIKPSNLMLNHNGVVKVLDLGLARIETQLSSVDDKQIDQHVDELTDSGTAMGTVGFMSPEQALDSSKVDHRADLYSLGATLYKLLAGCLPFPSEKYDTNGKMLVAIATEEPPSIATVRPDLPAKLVQLVDRTLAKEPGDRIPTAGEFAQHLAPFAGVSLAGIAALPAGELPPSLSDPDREIKTSAAAKRSKPRTWGLVATLAGVLVALSFAAQTFWVRTEHGMVLIEIADEQVEAKLKASGIEVVDQRNKKVWTINSRPGEPKSLPKGQYRFEAPAGLVITDQQGLEINAKEFKLLDADKQLRIRVSMAPADESMVASGNPPSASDPYARDLEAAKWVQSIGGEVFYVDDKLAPDARLQFVHMHGSGPYTPKDLERFAELPSLLVLKITDSTLDSQGLEPLLTCNNLRWLAFGNTKLDSDDFRRLSKLPRLSHLEITSNQVTDDWDFLSELRTLRKLGIGGDRIPALERLGDFPNLRHIDLPENYAPKKSVVEAIQAKNPRLMIVQTVDGQVSYFGMDAVREAAKELVGRGWQLHGGIRRSRVEWRSEMPDAWDEDLAFDVRGVIAPTTKGTALDQRDWELLEFLGYRFSIITLDDASNINPLPGFLADKGVDYLQLRNSSLTDETLIRLGDSCLIGVLNVTNSKVTRAGVEEFKRRQPTCHVSSSFGVYPAEHRLPAQGWRRIVKQRLILTPMIAKWSAGFARWAGR